MRRNHLIGPIAAFVGLSAVGCASSGQVYDEDTVFYGATSHAARPVYSGSTPHPHETIEIIPDHHGETIEIIPDHRGDTIDIIPDHHGDTIIVHDED